MEKEQKTLVTILPRETIPRPRPESIIVHTEALKKSIELISKFEYIIHDGDKHYSQSICNFCKNFFPTLQGKDYTCKSCGETFCVKHRQMLNHQCKKMTPAPLPCGKNTLPCCGGEPPGSRYSISWANGSSWGWTLRWGRGC